MSSKDLPKWLQKAISALPQEGKVQVADLYEFFKFDEDQFECFSLNVDSLSMENLPALKKFLEEQEAAKENKASKPAPKLGGASIVSGIKRKPLTSTAARPVALAGGMRASLGLGFAELSTPNPKRQREDPLDAALEGKGTPATPDPLPKPIQVSLKTSVNNQLTTTAAAYAASVKLLGDPALWTGSTGRGPYRWMDEAIEDRAAAQDARLVAMEGPLISAVLARPAAEEARMSSGDGEEEVATGIVGVQSQAEVVLCGRIVCEGLEGRLNERSVLLEGSRASSNGARVNLSLASCKHVAAFPGQIVGVLGRSGMGGSTFHARDFVAGIPPALPANPRGDAAVHMMVVAGPYCLRDGLDYTPLEQVLAHAARTHPQVLVLLGPFLAADNLKVSTGDLVLPNETEPCSYEEVYSKHILPRLAAGLKPLRRSTPATEVIIVPSLDEVLCFHPLPQPPLDTSLSLEARAFDQLKSLDVHMVPNPAHLEINGIRVSLCSADPLSSVLRELVLRPAERKIEEALRLLLYQRTLFPVLPRDPPQVSEARADAFDFPDQQVPDMCIFPSQMGLTGTFVDDTAFVNPGLLCRGTNGTFAEMWIVPPSGKADGHKLRDRVRVDIQKLG
mmetsp:Transcript_127417/g.220947  ORF Transcript_127417/g.220947 Transcript_127417/m.220947 type:complete len:619 (-) Transcript_127417:43-1899(-)